jgi:hypothetical protein
VLICGCGGPGTAPPSKTTPGTDPTGQTLPTGTDPVTTDPTDPTDPTTGTTGAPAFAPTFGTWTVLDRTVTDDACGLEEFITQGEPGAPFEVSEGTDPGTFMIEHSDGAVDRCGLEGADGQDFYCLDRQDTDPTAENLGATVELDIASTGRFSDADGFTMDVVVDADCTAGNCGVIEIAVGPFPCHLEMTLTMESGAP